MKLLFVHRQILPQFLERFTAAVNRLKFGLPWDPEVMVTPLPERTLFQGIIQLAAAYVHLARGETPGALKLLDAAVAKLHGFEPAHLGIEVGAMVEQAAAALRPAASYPLLRTTARSLTRRMRDSVEPIASRTPFPMAMAERTSAQ